MKNIGTYITTKVPGESFKTYIPPPLPLNPAISLEKLAPLLEKTTQSLTTLNAMSPKIPNTSLFVYMYVRKEALLSSQIEGTQSSFSDLVLFESNQNPDVSTTDIEDVSNYVLAINHAIARLEEGFPLSLRLLKETHAILLAAGRGVNFRPGEFRTTQNWIGGTRPGNALYVPPPIEKMADCLSNFEQFLHNEELPTLIKTAIAHVQFESIHPFLDGNGRLGRLLITLLLMNDNLLDSPILYLSLYLKQNRSVYYDLLQEVREHGRWEVWIEFFLNGVLTTSEQAIKTTQDIETLFERDTYKINTLGRARFTCLEVLERSKKLPQFSIGLIAKELDVSIPTARSAINHLVKLNVLEEITFKKRNKHYVYRDYLTLLEKGTEPL